MTIELTEDLERFIVDAVRTGRYARGDDVVRDALVRLRQAMLENALTADGDAEPQQARQLTKQEFHRHLVEIGLMSPPPETSAAPDASDEPLIDQEGEIISEAVIRERLIEWLVGFLER
jgi:putative addiction module CopG family antidote